MTAHVTRLVLVPMMIIIAGVACNRAPSAPDMVPLTSPGALSTPPASGGAPEAVAGEAALGVSAATLPSLNPPKPILTRIDPTSSAPGTVIVLSGSNLNPANSYMAPNALFESGGRTHIIRTQSVSRDQVRVTVPPLSGVVQVRLDAVGGKTAALPFSIKPPSISGISPRAGPPGTLVTISGHGFGVRQTFDASSGVYFGESLANPTTWSDTRIVVRAPSDYGTGVNWDILTSLGICIATSAASQPLKIILKRSLPGCGNAITDMLRRFQMSTTPGFLERHVMIKVRTAAGVSQLPFIYQVPVESR